MRKQKDGEDGGTFGFCLEPVTLEGTGPEPITSCIVAPVEAIGGEDAQERRPLTGVNAIALDALRRATEDYGTVPPASNHIPNGTRTVSPDLWRRCFYEMRSSETADTNKKAFQRAVVVLQNRHLATTWGPHSWLI